MKFPKVSIVLLAYDNLEFFVRAIESLQRNTSYPNFEIIVAQNSCKDESVRRKISKTCDDFYEKYDNFKFTINKENLYHAKGCASAFFFLDKECKYVVFANDDIFIPGNQLEWMTKLVSFMEENPKAASVTPCSLYPKETIYWCGKQDPNQPHHDFLHLPRNDPRLPKKPITTCYNNMCLMMTRRYFLDEIKLGIDTPPHYGSDSGFCNRVKELHPEMDHWVIPEIKVYHYNIYALRDNHNDDPVVDG